MKFDRLITANQFKEYWPSIKEVLADCYEKHRLVHVVVEPERKIRSTGPGSQNHHLNGHIQQIAMYTGQPFDDVKRYIKQQAVGMGYPQLQQFGHPVTDLWGNPIGISEKDASIQDCALLIEQSHVLASELGITLREEYET